MKFSLQVIIALLFFVVKVNGNIIPALNWIERSDWINVKTDKRVNALGNGLSDDTKALQTAIDLLDISNPDIRKRKSTVYLPEGKYLISSTLEMKLKRGVAIIGSGKNTTIIWTGAQGGTMFQSNGNNRCRFIGINWDGGSKAKYAVLHSNKDISAFETRIRHQYETFRNLEYGIAGMLAEKSTAGRGLATAETIIQNCHFEMVSFPIAIADFNFYNWVIDQCSFKKSKVAIYTPYGTCFVRNSRIEESSDADFVLGAYPNGYTIRRVESINSNRFIRHRAAFYLPCPLVLESCVVKNWKAFDAIHLLTRGPSMIIDCSFIKEGAKSPVQVLSDIKNGFKISNPNGKIHRMLISGNTINGKEQKFINLFGREKDVDILSIPKSFSVSKDIDLEDLDQAYSFKFSSHPASKVVDVLKAIPSSINPEKEDVSRILQQLIDKYSRNKEEVILYFPVGKYNVQQTLKINATNIVIQGSGFESSLEWVGSVDLPMISVESSRYFKMEQIKLSNKEIPQNYLITFRNPFNSKSFLLFDGVYHNHNVAKKNLLLQDVLFSGFSSNSFVYMNHAEFSFHSQNSSSATIVIDKFFNYYQTAIRISGPATNNFNGINFLSSVIVAGSSSADIVVEDNNSLVMTDLYHESGKNHLFLSGRGRGSGRISIQGVKHDFINKSQSDTLLYSNNYKGALFYGPQNFFNNVDRQKIIIRGKDLKAYFVGVNINDTLPNKTEEVKFLMSIIHDRKVQGDKIIENSPLSSFVISDISNSLLDIRLSGLIDYWIKTGENENNSSRINSLERIVSQ